MTPVPKPLVESSLSAVTTWAVSCFSDDFLKLPTCSNYILKEVMLPGLEGNGSQVKSIVVGTAIEPSQKEVLATVEVVAWLESHRVAVGYVSPASNALHVVAIDDIFAAAIRFCRPFSSILEAADETAVIRFESLIRHCFLARGRKNAIKGKGNFKNFRDHFPGACRDVARAVEQQGVDREDPIRPNNDSDTTVEPSTETLVGNSKSVQPANSAERTSQDSTPISDERLNRRITRSQTTKQPMSPPASTEESTTHPQHRKGSDIQASAVTVSTIEAINIQAFVSPAPSVAEQKNDPIQQRLRQMASDYVKLKRGLLNERTNDAIQMEELRNRLKILESDLTLSQSETTKALEDIITGQERHAALTTELEGQCAKNHELTSSLATLESEKSAAIDEMTTWKHKHALLSSEAEIQRGKVIEWEAKHERLRRELKNEQKRTLNWKSRHRVADKQAQQAREAEEVWKARYTSLKITLSDLISKQP